MVRQTDGQCRVYTYLKFAPDVRGLHEFILGFYMEFLNTQKSKLNYLPENGIGKTIMNGMEIN
jgi:hypothetical protein